MSFEERYLTFGDRKMHNFISFCLIFFVVYAMAKSIAAEVTKKPPNLDTYNQICYRSDPNVRECLKYSLVKLKPSIKTGIPERSFPSFDPYVVKQVTCWTNKTKLWYADFALINFRLWKLSEFQTKDLRVRLGVSDQIFIKLWFPNLNWRSNYRIRVNATLMRYAVEAKGLLEGNCVAVNISLLLKGNRLRENNLTYFHVQDIRLNFDDFSMKSLNFESKSVRDGNLVNSFLNENWKQGMKNINSILEVSIGQIVKELFNAIYNKFPLELSRPL